MYDTKPWACWLLAVQAVWLGNQTPVSVDITQEAYDQGLEARSPLQHET